MNIQQEKEHLYQLMNDVTIERRLLAEERLELSKAYKELKNRLDYIIQLEEQGIESLDIKSYVDMMNEKQEQTMIANITRESNHAINQIKQKQEERIKEKSTNPAEKPQVFKKELDLQKDNAARSKKKGKKSKQIPMEKMTTYILNILKEAETPISVKELHQRVCQRTEVEVSRANFGNNILHRAKKLNSRIEMVTRGYYQYRRHGEGITLSEQVME